MSKTKTQTKRADSLEESRKLYEWARAQGLPEEVAGMPLEDLIAEAIEAHDDPKEYLSGFIPDPGETTAMVDDDPEDIEDQDNQAPAVSEQPAVPSAAAVPIDDAPYVPAELPGERGPFDLDDVLADDAEYEPAEVERLLGVPAAHVAEEVRGNQSASGARTGRTGLRIKQWIIRHSIPYTLPRSFAEIIGRLGPLPTGGSLLEQFEARQRRRKLEDQLAAAVDRATAKRFYVAILLREDHPEPGDLDSLEGVMETLGLSIDQVTADRQMIREARAAIEHRGQFVALREKAVSLRQAWRDLEKRQKQELEAARKTYGQADGEADAARRSLMAVAQMAKARPMFFDASDPNAVQLRTITPEQLRTH